MESGQPQASIGEAVFEENTPQNSASSRGDRGTSGVDAYFLVTKQSNREFAIDAFDRAFAASIGRFRVLPGMSIHAGLPAAIAKPMIVQLRRCEKSGLPVQFELAIRHNRKTRQWSLSLAPLVSSRSRSKQFVGQARELSERATLNDVPAMGKNMLERLAATSHDIFYVFDLRRRTFVFINDRVRAVLGYELDELPSVDAWPFQTLVHPADAPIVDEHYQNASNVPDKVVRSVEYRVRRADGHYTWLRTSDAVFQRDAAGAVVSIAGSAIDVTDSRHLLEDMKKISSRLLEAQSEERRRIARELHDSTAQQLVAVSVGLARLDQLVKRDADRIGAGEMSEILGELRSIARDAQKEIRTLSFLLHPPVLESMGLAEALRKFIAGFARRTGIRARLNVADTFSCGSHSVSTALMRIAQEALINVFRHANATEVRVSLANRYRHTVLEVADNGNGITMDESADAHEFAALGVGISGMHARVQQFRGELKISSNSAGTTIRAAVPERAASLVHALN